ncbi:MAG TPA: hypothetical protein VIJ95_02450 [Hanamia sp.]
MTQNAQETKSLAEVGEDIGLAEGTKLVQNFREANPNATPGYYIGRNIIEQILSQPGCVGINFRKCLSENNEEHLVYTGVDTEGKDLLQYSVVTTAGDIEKYDGIVADMIIINWGLIGDGSGGNGGQKGS